MAFIPVNTGDTRWSALPARRVVKSRLSHDARRDWRALRAVPGGVPPAPGKACISWTPELLRVDAVFHGVAPRNRATRLNERTWELGDTFEFFLLLEDSSTYLEIHVTPENQRLQLRWPLDGHARVRAKREKLESFFISDPDWVTSQTQIDGDLWFTHLSIPAHQCGRSMLQPRHCFRTAVCRYHTPAGFAEPVLATTASFTAPGFHQPQHWNELVLVAGET